MMYRAELASDLYALQAVRGGACTIWFPTRRPRWASDESIEGNFASHGQEDHLAASGGDYRRWRPAHATPAAALRTVWRFRGLFERRCGTLPPGPDIFSC